MNRSVIAGAIFAACLVGGCSQETQNQITSGQEQAKAAEQLGEKANEASKAAADAGQKIKAGVDKAQVASEAAIETGKVKSALGFASGLDMSNIDVSTDLPTKTIKMTGTVPSAAELDQANSLVKAIAGNEYKVDSSLAVKK
jgi:osmotically-inducible protein OsmY